MNLQQNKRVHALLSSNGLIPDKAYIVASFTSGRSESSCGLTESEADEMIAWLQSNKPQDADNKMRRKIISLAYEMQWARPGDWQAAIKAIDIFCEGKHGVFKKALNLHTHKELVQVVSQFESLYKKHLKGI